MLEPSESTELENLRLAAKRFEQLFQGLPIACLGCDLEGTIFEWNRACERILSISPSLLFMSSVFSVLCKDEHQNDRLSDMLDGMMRGEAYESFEWALGGEDASKHLLCSMLPKPGPDGRIVGAIFSAIDMTAQKAYERQIEAQLQQIHQYSSEIELRRTELETANRRLESLAWTDGLTGLSNHRAFYGALNKEVDAAAKHPTPISVVMLDVDDFKSYNDTYGHPEGDSVLRQVAAALLSVSRRNDLVARYGGEEFVVLLVGADAPRAEVVAERMRRAIESAPWPLRPITASFGVATMEGQSMDGETLVAHADSALYLSKRAGKNRVIHARSQQPFGAAA